MCFPLADIRDQWSSLFCFISLLHILKGGYLFASVCLFVNSLCQSLKWISTKFSPYVVDHERKNWLNLGWPLKFIAMATIFGTFQSNIPHFPVILMENSSGSVCVVFFYEPHVLIFMWSTIFENNGLLMFENHNHGLLASQPATAIMTLLRCHFSMPGFSTCHFITFVGEFSGPPLKWHFLLISK